jgi:exonuclease SbcC
LKPSCETELEQSDIVLADIDKSVQETGSSVKRLRAEAQVLDNAKTQLSRLAPLISRHHEDIAREKEALNKSLSNLTEYKKLLNNQAIIESGFQELNATRKSLDEMNQRARQLSRLNEKYNQMERTRDHAQNELNTQHKLAENNIRQLELKCGKLPELKQEQRKIAAAQHELALLETEIRKRRENATDRTTALSNVTETIFQLKKQVSEIDEKLRILLETQSGPRCPLCETELGAHELELVKAKYIDEKEKKLESIKQNESESARLSAEIKTGQLEIAGLENKQKNDFHALTTQETRIEQFIKDGLEASAKLADEKRKLAEIEGTLATQNYATAELEAIAGIRSEMALLSYDEKEHDDLHAQVEKLAVWEEQKRLLDEALNRLEQEKNNAGRSERIIDEVNTRLAADNLLQKELSGQLTELPEISRKLELAEIESTRRLEEQRNFREKIAVLKERIKQLEELEKRGLEKRRSLDEATEKENLYRQLTTIFGKKGLQAMLIETALPEIEAEANRLLARMTDGRMNLTFETQQPTKKGDISETLEIKIADELGTRNYEMFSGGEAFRIDFSIRVALSRLLARRAGAPLPTLIIDEGFGTQDADGIEKLKEAINSVQDDFQKILVITHIDELKDAFPTRIDVVKKAEGSTIEIS